MVCESAKLFMAFLDAEEITYDVVNEEKNIISLGTKLKNTRIDIYFQFDADNSNIHIEGLNFVEVPEDAYDKLYSVINSVNLAYRWVKFTLNTANSVLAAEADAVITIDTAADITNELMLRLASIVDDNYATFMKAIWS